MENFPAASTREGPCGENVFFSEKKVSQFRSKLKGFAKQTEIISPLISPGILCYAEQKENPFWFSSLSQMVQFDTIKFRITL